MSNTAKNFDILAFYIIILIV